MVMFSNLMLLLSQASVLDESWWLFYCLILPAIEPNFVLLKKMDSLTMHRLRKNNDCGMAFKKIVIELKCTQTSYMLVIVLSFK